MIATLINKLLSKPLERFFDFFELLTESRRQSRRRKEALR